MNMFLAFSFEDMRRLIGALGEMSERVSEVCFWGVCVCLWVGCVCVRRVTVGSYI